MALPKVVLVGRKNVGKSTLFNRLSVDVKSITLDVEGVTRDFLSDVVSWQGVDFELIDSAGIGLKKEEDALDEEIRTRGLALIDDADLVLFVVDGSVGVTQDDQEINKFLFKRNKKVFLVINKVDTAAFQDHIFEFAQLGHKTMLEISASHATGIGEVLEAVVNEVRGKGGNVAEDESGIKIALLGKPNVGKSSLMNLLVQKERTIVSERAGTTREAISSPVQFFKQTILVTDTPGIRRKRGVTETLETMMVKTAFRAVEDANVILLLVDGSEGTLSDQELKLAFYAFDKEHKAVIILVNKDDIMAEENRTTLAFNLEEYPHLTKRVPVLFISCKTGRNVNKILPLVEKVYERFTHTFDNFDLTTLFKEALNRRPLYVQGNLIELKRAKQVKTGPITIVLFVNHPQFIDDSHLAYFDNVLRRTHDLQGAPVRFVVRR